jgi:hypothetical protein
MEPTEARHTLSKRGETFNPQCSQCFQCPQCQMARWDGCHEGVATGLTALRPPVSLRSSQSPSLQSPLCPPFLPSLPPDPPPPPSPAPPSLATIRVGNLLGAGQAQQASLAATLCVISGTVFQVKCRTSDYKGQSRSIRIRQQGPQGKKGEGDTKEQPVPSSGPRAGQPDLPLHPEDPRLRHPAFAFAAAFSSTSQDITGHHGMVSGNPRFRPGTCLATCRSLFFRGWLPTNPRIHSQGLCIS